MIRERASLLRYTYIACLFNYTVSKYLCLNYMKHHDLEMYDWVEVQLQYFQLRHQIV
jgi:hypothetical protein